MPCNCGFYTPAPCGWCEEAFECSKCFDIIGVDDDHERWSESARESCVCLGCSKPVDFLAINKEFST